ncbi:MAG: alpha-L-fucosidase [Clostridia bacterium]|nr:alpha-L-fucosidase [Clostridia bacterium]
MKIKPTQKQLDFLDWEFGIFFHFGIRSFFPGHKDWDGRPMPASAFNPAQLDCKQWVRTAKNAGAKYCILTTKHHDGFANWPSKYSDYSVAQSPWQDGKGDVVKEYVEACRAYGLKVGLYYSPAQWGGTVKFDNPVEYDDYFINQISELLTNYGQIDYLWFDGCGSENHEYDKPRIVSTIRTLQPGIRIFDMWDPESRWVGNEDGYADMPNVNVVDQSEFSIFADEARPLDTTRYLPAECDMRMRSGTWFDCEANADTVRSVEELLGIWEYSVGRGANLLLNIGPDSRGLLPEPDAARLLEFGQALRARYGEPLPFNSMVQENETLWSIINGWLPDWNPHNINTTLVDTLVIEEDITEGEAVSEFRVLATLPGVGKTCCVYRGCTIGHKAICRFPAIRTGKLRVEVLASDGPAKLKSMKAYYVGK